MRGSQKGGVVLCSGHMKGNVEEEEEKEHAGILSEGCCYCGQ